MVLGTQHLEKKKNQLKVSFVWHQLVVNFYFLYKLLCGLCATTPEITTHLQIITGIALHQTSAYPHCPWMVLPVKATIKAHQNHHSRERPIGNSEWLELMLESIQSLFL